MVKKNLYAHVYRDLQRVWTKFCKGIGRITWQQPWFLCLNCWGNRIFKVVPRKNTKTTFEWIDESIFRIKSTRLPDNSCTILDELARNNAWFHFILLGGDSHSFYYYQGCYIDTGSRILSHQILTDSESQGNMTNSACINGCMEHGMQLYHSFPMWIKWNRRTPWPLLTLQYQATGRKHY